MNLCDPEAIPLTNGSFRKWRRYIENKEMLAQAKDSEMAKRFWDERP